MGHTVSLIRGDGIGPEIIEQTLRVLQEVGAGIDWEEVEAGSRAALDFGDPLPRETLASIEHNRIVLKAPLETPVGSGYRSVNVAIRKHFDMYANVRPAKTIHERFSRFPNVDLVTIRENTEGAYIGIEHAIPPNRSAAETVMLITRYGSERIVRFAFDYARQKKRKKVTLVHKANILKETGGLFLEVGRTVAREYSDIEFEDIIIDNMAMQMVRRPESFDVVVTTNLFGDILSDLAAGLVGGLGLTPGANVGPQVAMFEAVHGTAPDIAGQGVANPTALMLSAVLMLEHLEMDEKADKMREAIYTVLRRGECLTRDLGGRASTREYADAICREIQA